MKYNIILAAAILGIVGWCSTRPIDTDPRDPLNGEPCGSLMMSDFQWSEDGTSATFQVIDTQKEIMHEILYFNQSFERQATRSCFPGKIQEDECWSRAFFNSTGYPEVVIFYEIIDERIMLHFSINENDRLIDITARLMSVI